MDTTTISDPANDHDDVSRTGKSGTPSSQEGLSGFNSRAERYPFRSGTPQSGARGPATSALTRDAARLRSVMGQAAGRADAEQGNGGDTSGHPAANGARQIDGVRRRGDFARAVDAPPFPDLDPSGGMRPNEPGELRTSALSQLSNESDRDTSGRRPTMLRMPGERETIPSADAAISSGHGGATRLRPVAALIIEEPDTNAGHARPDHRDADAPAVKNDGAMEPDRGADLPYADPEPTPAAPAVRRSEPLPFSAYDSDGRMGAEPISISVDIPPMPRSAPPRAREGRGKVVLTVTMVVIGTAIGVGLYAGGGDFLSGIFSNKREGVAMQSPSAVTERPIVEQPSLPVPSPAGAMPQGSDPGRGTGSPAPVESSVASAEASPAPTPREDGAATPTPRAIETRGEGLRSETSEPDSSPAAGRLRPDEGNRAERIAAERPKRDDAKRDDVKRDEEKKPEPDKSAPKSGRYLVQVRATPDESEAKLIAKRLRSRGAAGVAIVPSEKNGTTIYRVRFTSTGSDEAKELAAKAGYGNVWVMKQK